MSDLEISPEVRTYAQDRLNTFVYTSALRAAVMASRAVAEHKYWEDAAKPAEGALRALYEAKPDDQDLSLDEALDDWLADVIRDHEQFWGVGVDRGIPYSVFDDERVPADWPDLDTDLARAKFFLAVAPDYLLNA